MIESQSPTADQEGRARVAKQRGGTDADLRSIAYQIVPKATRTLFSDELTTEAEDPEAICRFPGKDKVVTVPSMSKLLPP